MTGDIPTYPEDEEIQAKLDDPTDLEAFANLVENAHREGVSAVEFVREEPNRTSRKRIRRLCLKNRKRSLKMILSSFVGSLRVQPPETQNLNLMFGTGKPTKPVDCPDGSPLNGRG